MGAPLSLVLLLAFVVFGDVQGVNVKIQPWGANSVRVRVSNGAFQQLPGALGPTAPSTADTEVVETIQSTTNGNIRASSNNKGTVTIEQLDLGAAVLVVDSTKVPPATTAGGAGSIQLHGVFNSIYGFGEHQLDITGLNLVGKTFDMESCLEYGHSHGGEICLPFMFGVNRTTPTKPNFVGFFWNMPGYGNVTFNKDEKTVTWNAHNGVQLDFFVTVGPAKVPSGQQAVAIIKQYTDAVGRVPHMPEYAGGYWHSKNRYKTEKGLLAAAAEFHQRKIPVDIIVIDYHHWVHFGDWSFDPQYWPTPQKMVDTIKSYGMEIMVSVWPFTSPHSNSYVTIRDQKLCAVNSTDQPQVWPDPNPKPPCFLYDPTQEAARNYVWSWLKKGYYDYGIKIFWLDASEPEQIHGTPKGSAYSLGSMQRMGMMFPYYHSQMVHDGLKSEGVNDIVMLARSGWAGSPKWASAVWSGDTQSKWDVLHTSIYTMQNAELSGLFWWTTDIGGYAGGQPSKDWFQELIIRWFQFGVTCPIFRQHGARATEPWKLQNATYTIVVDIIKLRYTFKNYVLEQLAEASEKGVPFNRPLWFEFPSDSTAVEIEDEYMMGSGYLVAPVYTKGQRTRKVYLPEKGTDWQHYFTKKVYAGGQSYVVPAPLDHFPLFERMGNSPEKEAKLETA